MWHSDLHKRKPTGGKRKPSRGRRKFERGGFPVETVQGPEERRLERVRGGNFKVRLKASETVQVSDPKTGKTVKASILRVVRNPANIEYSRRGVITRGTILETDVGLVRVTSRPSQNGVLNAVLLESSEAA
ncbi:MAG: 30S ribosomal protein S8e [Candidatus Hecatellaceae archaeon]|nr:MAG: 30S ribosomal protein S8e [Candidatus Hecatellales archaeon]